MDAIRAKRLSIKEYHIMLTGYHGRLLDTYEIASIQALFNRNAQSDKVKSLDDIYKRPENTQMIEARARERKRITEQIQANESLFNQIEQALKGGGNA